MNRPLVSNNRTGFLLKQGGDTLQSMTYTYDAVNRLDEVKESGTTVAGYAYDANGNRSSLVYTNSNTEDYAYNLANAVTSLQNKQGSTVLSSYAYTYYLDGNQESKTDHNGVATSYTYDGAGRLSARACRAATRSATATT
jgi:YD repeat-containing protein